ncbi:hypothetical protein PYJP_17220 [Pyrofollis japonicus]|uniref:hypothetical protein n=1 Tax=Pyrofollis japonicus TaxID=3060460 RepID=UPI00295B11BC|nr:hypothetical protein [Pyrofollis japonicus]BEP18370.1 hypothetical protein PYJP_17220 [Pyrofollis japonicus]
MEDRDKLSMILRAYQVYFRKLAFDQLPRIAEKYLGEAGFRVVADALAEATVAALPGLIEATKDIVSIPKGDFLKVLEVHYSCHSAARSITLDESIGLFTPKRISDNRLELVSEQCPFGAKGLQLAAFVGVVVGVLRALGARAVATRDPESRKYLSPGDYLVYAEDYGEKGCKIVVEKVEAS